jgi:four helix bundle protein
MSDTSFPGVLSRTRPGRHGRLTTPNARYSPLDNDVWQLAYELKLGVYALIRTRPLAGDRRLVDQLRSAASSAPHLIAEGYGRYFPREFSRYLRNANGELKETFDALRDAVDRGYLVPDQIIPLQRLSRRASKAATELIKYLRTAKPPHEIPPRRRTPDRRTS